MKKIFILLILILSFALIACNNNSKNAKESDDEATKLADNQNVITSDEKESDKTQELVERQPQIGTETPIETETPMGTETPVETETAVGTGTPIETETPVGTGTPIETETPVETEIPVDPTELPIISLYTNFVRESQLYFELYPLMVGDEFDFHTCKEFDGSVIPVIGEGKTVIFEDSKYVGIQKSEDDGRCIDVDDNLHAKVLNYGICRVRVQFVKILPDAYGFDQLYKERFIVYVLANGAKYDDRTFLYTSKPKDEFEIEYLYYDSFYYVFKNGEQISANFISAKDNKVVRLDETDRYKIINREYEIVSNINDIEVSIDQNGIISSAEEKISGITIKITITIYNKRDNTTRTQETYIGGPNEGYGTISVN